MPVAFPLSAQPGLATLKSDAQRARCDDAVMRRVNLTNPELSYDPEDPDGFRSGMARFGPQLGAKETGASLYELPPGQALCPYHYEYGEEEWLLVVSGQIGRASCRERV